MERRLSVLLPICAAHEGASLVYFGDDPVATASAAATATAATSTATATHAVSPARLHAGTDVEPSPDAVASSPDVLPLAARLARARRAAT